MRKGGIFNMENHILEEKYIRRGKKIPMAPSVMKIANNHTLKKEVSVMRWLTREVKREIA